MVSNLNVLRACIGPNEADPELIVNAYAVLSRSVSYQRFEAIARRRFMPFPGKRQILYNLHWSAPFAVPKFVRKIPPELSWSH